MRFGKVFKVFKKGTKTASKRKGKGAAAAGGFEWPSGVRIGVYGHANSGKTVYFTVLNEECKVAKNLQISVTDNATAGEFLTNYRAIWGMGTAMDVGTVVDLREEKKFPNPTQSDRLLLFTVIIDRKKKVPVVVYDYDGKAVSISGKHELTEKVMDFMAGCDGLLFFHDPKTLGAELQSQEHVASFVNMLERLAPLNRRLPIPVTLVVTKADILPGFSGESQTVLISPEDEHFLAEDYELFLERVLSSNKVASNSAWAGSVRNILVKLKEFLKVVVGRTLDFQIFFVSSTGQTPEKIGADVGRSIYAPPAKIRPIGIKEPFYWILNSIRRSRRISVLRKLTKYAAVLSLIWIAVFSLPYLYHFQWVLPRTTRVEDNVRKAYGGSVFSIPRKDLRKIDDAYRKYEHSWTVKWLFSQFLVPAKRVRDHYKNIDINDARRELNKLITRVTATVRDTAHWPTINPSTDSLQLTPDQMQWEASLDRFHQGDSTSELYVRSGRVLALWDLFKKSLVNPSDTAAWDKLVEQVKYDSSLYGKELGKEEVELGSAFTETALARKETKEKKVTVAQAGTEFDQLVEEINNNPDPEFRLGKAVKKLRNLMQKLSGNPARQQDVQRISTYLSQARYFQEYNQYKFKLLGCPEDHHIHVVVKKGGKTGDWPKNQIFMGNEFHITWRSGDHILIALDEKHVDKKESWGDEPKDLKELKDPFAIFKMDGEVRFPSTAMSIVVSSQDNLKAKLPKF